MVPCKRVWKEGQSDGSYFHQSLDASRLRVMPSIPRCKPRGRHPYQRLTALHVRHLKKGRYADGLNLYLKVDESGARRWMWRGRIKGKRHDIGIGPVALISLAEARQEAARLKR